MPNHVRRGFQTVVFLHAPQASTGDRLIDRSKARTIVAGRSRFPPTGIDAPEIVDAEFGLAGSIDV